jgi:hypothetical protein
MNFARPRRISVSVVLLAACAAAGCSTKDSTSASSAKSNRAGKAVDAATVGSITGRVTIIGTPPALRGLDMSAEPSCQAAHRSPMIPPQVVADASGDLANVIVYVKTGASEYVFRPPSVPAKLHQTGCLYEPRVLGVMTGQKLDVLNEDQATHNVFVMSKANSPSNRSEIPGSPAIEETFIVPELAIPVKCNVHPWMKAYLFVFDHPFYAVTSRDGKFALNGLPPGTYTIGAWQELYGTQEQTVTIEPKQSANLNFSFKAE